MKRMELLILKRYDNMYLHHHTEQLCIQLDIIGREQSLLAIVLSKPPILIGEFLYSTLLVQVKQNKEGERKEEIHTTL